MSRLLLIIFISLLPFAGNAGAAYDGTAYGTLRPLPYTADTAVWLVTLYPGADVYQLEGHTAIAVQINGRPTAAYNFGVFDFSSPNFLWRFVTGQTDYMAVKWPYDAFMAEYVAERRRATALRISLDSEAKRRLITALDSIVLPQNRTYRYNYVKDNCATRPLSAINSVFPDTITLGGPPVKNHLGRLTFRNVMRRYHSNYPWYQFGIDLALGSGIDYALDPAETAFAPVELETMLRNAYAGGSPIVDKVEILIDLPPQNAISSPTPWWCTPMAAAIAVLLASAGVSIADIRRKRITRLFDAILFGIYGIAGCLLTFLIFVSVHEATSPNWLYLWLNPLCLLPCGLIWLRRCTQLLRIYQCANLTILTALLCCWHWIPQSANPAFFPLIAAEMIRAATYLALTRRHAAGK